MRVAIVGAGRVGLITGVCLAEKGHQVICVDVDSRRVETINRGLCPFHEKGLTGLLAKNVGRSLRATTDLPSAILESELSFICVGTPFDGDEIELTYVREAALQVGTALRDRSAYHVVVVKSTVIPGTTDEVVGPLMEQASGKKAGQDFGLGMNPEFLTEGQAVEDFLAPDRLILGGGDERTLGVLEEVYRDFEGVERVRTRNKTAEMIKYVSNSLLATLISFSNEMANLCGAMGGVDAVEVERGVHLSHYLSPRLPNGERIVAPIAAFLAAGCGFGGSCLPKDTQALIAHGKKVGAPMRLLESVVRINEEQHQQVLARLRKHFSSLQGVRVSILGLAFRPGTDDIRESPALPLIRALRKEGADLFAYDQAARREAEKIFRSDELTFCDELEQALDGAQAVVLVTSWDEFRRVPELLAGRKPQPVFIDGRRMLDKRSLERYEGIGL